MVVQLLGVIVAAIAVAAVASVVGLMLLRALIRPIRDRPSTFVAWSFLRAQTIDDPLPVRVGRAIRRQVSADPTEPAPRSFLRPLLGALACWGAIAAIVWRLNGLLTTGGDLGAWWAIGIRDVGIALVIESLLLLSASFPWRRARLVVPGLLLFAALAALLAAPFHPLAARFVHAPALVIAAVLALGAVGYVVTRPRHHALRSARGWVGRGLWIALGLLALAVAGLGYLPNRLVWVSVLPIVACTVLYLLAQAQPKVTLPVFVSIVGVAAGTWALIVVLSVMGGFAADLRAKMLVANAHALVERPGRARPLQHWQKVSEALRQVEGVVAASPQVRGDAILSSTFNVNTFVSLRGIDPALPEVQRELGSTVVTGSLRLLSQPDRLGRDTWRARRPEGVDTDLPEVATGVDARDASPASEAEADSLNDDLDALLQLPPGPSAPQPPIVGEHEPIFLPSGAAPSDQLGQPGEQLEPTEADDASGDEAHEKPAANGDDPAEDSGATGLLDLPWSSGRRDVMTPVAPAILLGAELARSLQVELGDRVEVITPDADVGPTGMRPRVRTFRVAGTFETGLYDADSKVAYVTLTAASRYFNLEGAANVIELRLANPAEPDGVLALIDAALKAANAPPDIEVLDWRELNRSLFSALAFERLVIFLVLALIILVASFAIVSALTMVILQKRNGIAMLQAMGASRKDIRAAFVQMGGAIGAIGTTAGVILGLTTCLLIDSLGIQLPDAYYVRTLPVAIVPSEIAAVVVASLLISLVATVFPAKSAARLSPLEGLRYE